MKEKFFKILAILIAAVGLSGSIYLTAFADVSEFSAPKTVKTKPCPPKKKPVKKPKKQPVKIIKIPKIKKVTKIKKVPVTKTKVMEKERVVEKPVVTQTQTQNQEQTVNVTQAQPAAPQVVQATPSTLPETGTADVAGFVLGGSTLVGSYASYRKSRKYLKNRKK